MASKNYFWKTARIKKETTDTVTIQFNTNGQAFSHKPGQFINLSMVLNGERHTRSYSLSSAPGDAFPAITIKKVPGGLISSYIVDHHTEVKEWMVDGAHGFFCWDEKTVAQQVVLIGGGSGITPLFSILKHLLTNTTANILLIDCNRTIADIIFYEELSGIKKDFSDRLRVYHMLSKEADLSNADQNFMKGRLSKLVLKKIVKKEMAVAVQDALYFLCGPAGLIQLAEEALYSLGVSVNNIKSEHFATVAEDAPEQTLPGQSMEVLLHHYESTNLLVVAPGKTILESALEDKIPLSYSCRNGTCGVCVGKLTSGQVHMKNNFAIPADKLEQGYILLCQSHPLNNEVTVEAGLL